jgi:hypothetical protein
MENVGAFAYAFQRINPAQFRTPIRVFGGTFQEQRA